MTAIYSGGYGDFNKIRIVGTGSTDIVANQPGSVSFAPALPITKTITVSKQNQTITFNPFPPKSVGDFDFDPGAVASSSLPISYSSSDTSQSLRLLELMVMISIPILIRELIRFEFGKREL